MDEIRVDRMETIQEYAIPPWEPRLQVTLEPDKKKAAELVSDVTGIVIATSDASCRKVARSLIWPARLSTRLVTQNGRFTMHQTVDCRKTVPSCCRAFMT
jgi:hypothetical protein